MANVNIKEVEGGEVTSVGANDGIELDTGSVSNWIKFSNFVKSFFGSASQGDTLYYNGTTWTRLAAGTLGNVLSTQGAGANPQWTALTTGLATKFLNGLNLSNNGSDATNDIDVAIGKCRDILDTMDISLTSAITKRLDAAWAVGSGNGGLDQGSIANATYHIHLIKRSDTSVVDAIFSLSHDDNFTVTVTIASPGVVTWAGKSGAGHGLVAGSTFKFTTTGALPTGITAGTVYYVISTGITLTTFQFSATNGGAAINTTGSQSGTHTGYALPLLPTSYDGYRRIGSVIRASAALLAFIQDGDHVSLSAPIAEFSADPGSISAITRTLTGVPQGIRVRGYFTHINNQAAVGATGVWLTDIVCPDIAPTTTYNNLFTPNNGVAAAVVFALTNQGKQIRTRHSARDASTVYTVITVGWDDFRGR